MVSPDPRAERASQAPPGDSDAEAAPRRAGTPPWEVDQPQRWSQAEMDAEIARLGDVPMYPGGQRSRRPDPALDPDATAPFRPIDAVDPAGHDTAAAGQPPKPRSPRSPDSEADHRLKSYGWLFTGEPRPGGPRPPLWRGPELGAGGSLADGPATQPIPPVSVPDDRTAVRLHPVASAVPPPARSAVKQPAATERPTRSPSPHPPSRRSGRSRHNSTSGGGQRIVIGVLTLAVILSLGSAAAIVGYGMSQSATPLANLGTTPSASESGPPMGQTWDGEVTPIAGVTAEADCVASPGQDRERGVTVPYEPGNALDGDLETGWRCDDDVNPTLTFDVPPDSRIAEVSIVNGYAKDVDGTDRYPLYLRVLTVRWTFSDGTTVTQDLEDDVREPQAVRVPVCVGGTVTLEVLKVTNPSVQAAARDAVVISEVQFSAPTDG